MEIGQDIKTFQSVIRVMEVELKTFFTESTLPGISSRFTIAGTASSGIRSMWTGSDQTRPCQSRYGIQDIVGNVEEILDEFQSGPNLAGNHFSVKPWIYDI